MRRWELIALCGSIALVPRALAQSPRMHRVGLLSPGAPITEAIPQSAPFLNGMAQHGYRAGHNLADEVIE
jgi:putative tryptophan/tyrosine transport system substrate-binding protein